MANAFWKQRPYVSSVNKVKNGKSVRRQRIKAKRIRRLEGIIEWCQKYPGNRLTFAQMYHPQMLAIGEARSLAAQATP